MEEITEQLSTVIRRIWGITNLSEEDCYELQNIAIDLEDIRDQAYEAKNKREPGERPAFCLFCNNEFWHSQGHTCNSITYYYERSKSR